MSKSHTAGQQSTQYEQYLKEQSWDTAYRYMLLSRLEQDCLYFLGDGGRCEKYLWAGSIVDQLGYLKALWNSFPEGEKPQWLSFDKILYYEKQMTQDLS